MKSINILPLIELKHTTLAEAFLEYIRETARQTGDSLLNYLYPEATKEALLPIYLGITSHGSIEKKNMHAILLWEDKVLNFIN